MSRALEVTIFCDKLVFNLCSSHTTVGISLLPKYARNQLSFWCRGNKLKVIYGVCVERGPPCGSTWYVARKLIGKEVRKEEIRDVVAKTHHSYPCTATMSVDSEIGEPSFTKRVT